MRSAQRDVGGHLHDIANRRADVGDGGHLAEHSDATAEELLNKAKEIAQKETAQE